MAKSSPPGDCSSWPSLQSVDVVSSPTGEACMAEMELSWFVGTVSDPSSVSEGRSDLAVDSSMYWKNSSRTRLLTSQYFCISFRPMRHICALFSASRRVVSLDRWRLMVCMQREENRQVILCKGVRAW